jgi:subtilisin family serine protease
LALFLFPEQPNANRLHLHSQAIDHAVDQKARIISMSWSVKAPPPGDERDRFDRAIGRAIRAGIIILCAASDQGEMGDETYPHASNKGYIFRIGAATSHGTTTGYAGDPKDIQFSFPGHGVMPKDDSPDRHLGDVQHGSSVATALAAALAALVLECVRLGHLRVVRMPRESRYRMSFPIEAADVGVDAGSMKTIFQKMSRSNTGYVRVWEWFGVGDNEKLSDDTSEERLELIAGLAWRFLGK